MKTILIVTLLLITAGNSHAQINCDTLHTGSFVYLNESQEEVFVLINKKTHTEFHNNGKYYIKSKIKWINNCEYTATIKKSTLPILSGKKGLTMTTRFIETDKNKIIYQSTILNRTWKGEMFKIEAIPEKVDQ